MLFIYSAIRCGPYDTVSQKTNKFRKTHWVVTLFLNAGQKQNPFLLIHFQWIWIQHPKWIGLLPNPNILEVRQKSFTDVFSQIPSSVFGFAQTKIFFFGKIFNFFWEKFFNLEVVIKNWVCLSLNVDWSQNALGMRLNKYRNETCKISKYSGDLNYECLITRNIFLVILQSCGQISLTIIFSFLTLWFI